MLALGHSFSSYSYTDFLRPLYIINAMLVEFADQIIACKNEVLLKQFNTRVTTFSGLFDLAFTIGWSFYEKNDLYTGLMGMFTKANTGISCVTYGKYWGMVVAGMFSQKTPSQVFFNDVVPLEPKP